VILGDATGVDAERRQVLLADGSSVPYDSLIVATGTEYAYFGHDEWREHAPSLKSVEDVAEIRRRLLFAFESAERETDPERRAAWLTFVVVGGGTTGVELAGAIAELARQTLHGQFRAVDPREARVILVEQRERVLPEYPEALSSVAGEELRELAVTVRTETSVVDVRDTAVVIRAAGSEEQIDAMTVLWAAGVRASAFARRVAATLGATTDRRGRFVVEADLSVPGHPEVLVVGDVAAITPANGQLVPAVAQGAIQGGRHAARVITARLRGRPSPGFRYRDIGELAMVGRFRVVARLPMMMFAGVFAWLMWLGIHLFYLSGVQNRLLVAVRWMSSLVTGARGSRLITAAVPSDSRLPLTGRARETRLAAAARFTPRDRRT
jgi:NADH dehydrogenase